MTETYRLRRLQVSVPRHEDVEVGLCLGNDGTLRFSQRAIHRLEFFHQIQADIGGHLIVAASASV